jgi:hypothetical protein
VQSEPTDLCAALRARYSLPPPPPPDLHQSQSRACLPTAHNILFVIATAPNPANSQLALGFDRAIESIEQAAGDRGFLFDRFVFPWDAEPHRQSDPQKKRSEEQLRRRSEAKPGMLLFRGVFGEDDPMHRFESLAVMLVPENPSSGINGDAFEAAATFAKENSINTPPLAILGPCYSSSAESLHDAIHRTNLRYRILSGCATVPVAWKLLNAHADHPFYAMVRDDDQSGQALDKFLDQWQKLGRVALLSESGTLYGAFASNSRQSSDLIKLIFPRGISWLRNAYQDLPAAAAPGLPAGVVSPIARLLPFAISEPTYGDDKTPSLSAAQTPISQEAALLSIANTLRRERVRFVVITSTDPLDNIFLIRFLRAHSPDLRIITFESDLLYVRAATEFPATGVVLVTTYPLFLQNQAWTGSSDFRMQFVSMGSEGTYNALRSILMLSAPGDEQLSTDSARAGPHKYDRHQPRVLRYEDWVVDYRAPFESRTRKPPVWITVTTPSGYWPLAVLGDSDLTPSLASDLLFSWPVERQKDKRGEAERPPVIERVSRLWYSLAFGLISICTLPLLAVQGRLNLSNLPLLRSFAYRPLQDANAFGLAFFRAVVFLSLAMLCWLLAWPTVVLWRNGPGWEALTVAGMLAAMVVGLLLTSVYDVVRRRLTPAAVQNRHYRYMLIGAIALFAFWLYNWLWTFYGGRYHQGFFAAYRSLDLVNGVAPTIPFALIVLALISWASVHLKRLRMFDGTPHSVPALGMRFLEGTRAAELAVQISLVNDAVENPSVLPALGCVIGWAALYFVMREYTQSLELHPFDVLYGVAFSLVLLLVMLTCSRMVLIWTRLRRMLRTIELHPVRETFRTVALVDNWGPILHRGIEPDGLERRHRELLGKAGGAPLAAISDRALEDIRNELLDPAWARQDVEGASFKASSELFALPYVVFIQATCRQIENLLVFLSAGFVLTLISLNSYPFQSGHVLGWFMAILLIVIGLAVGFVLASSERDPVLSRLNGTKPGTIGKDFYWNLLSYGALPVLTLLAVQFPSIGSFLFSWVQPLLQALRG